MIFYVPSTVLNALIHYLILSTEAYSVYTLKYALDVRIFQSYTQKIVTIYLPTSKRFQIHSLPKVSIKSYVNVLIMGSTNHLILSETTTHIPHYKGLRLYFIFFFVLL